MVVDAVPAPFVCEVVPDRERVVVVLGGELDLATAPAVWKVVEELLPAGFAKVTVDLSGLTFLDSSGLHVLMAANNLAAEHDCLLSLIPGPDRVQRTFELADVTTALTFEPAASR